MAQCTFWLGHLTSSWVHIIKPSAACLRPFHVDRGHWWSVKGILADSGKTPGAWQRAAQRSAENMDEATGKRFRLTITFVQPLEGNLSMNGGEKCTTGVSGRHCIIYAEEHKQSLGNGLKGTKWSLCIRPLIWLRTHAQTHALSLSHTNTSWLSRTRTGKHSHRPRGSKDEASTSQTPDVHLLPLTEPLQLQEKIIVLAGKCIDCIRCRFPSGFTSFTCQTTHLGSAWEGFCHLRSAVWQ